MRLARTMAMLAIITMLTGACETSSSTNPSGVDPGLGSQDATGDVTLGDCKPPNYGTISCTLEIVNHSDGTSDYYVEAALIDGKGANIGTANASASHIEAGQTAHSKLSGFFDGSAKDFDHVEITTVQRTAS